MRYAIGDIHGCVEPLRRLLDRLAPGPEDEMVFLGDYVDRGPSSREVLDLLLQLRGPRWTFLRGNHEQMMLNWLEERDADPSELWILNGGFQTLRSYLPGLTMASLRSGENSGRLREAVPPAHRDFLHQTRLSLDTPDAFFCHAGIDLGKPLASQTPEVLLWVRESFWKDPRPCPKLIVSGHTPRREMDLAGDRIDLDTGCVYGGVLSALRLPDRALFQVEA